MEKMPVTDIFSFSHNVFKSLFYQSRKNQGLFGKGLSAKAASGLNTVLCEQLVMDTQGKYTCRSELNNFKTALSNKLTMNNYL